MPSRLIALDHGVRKVFMKKKLVLFIDWLMGSLVLRRSRLLNNIHTDIETRGVLERWKYVYPKTFNKETTKEKINLWGDLDSKIEEIKGKYLELETAYNKLKEKEANNVAKGLLNARSTISPAARAEADAVAVALKEA